jgi:hypothetical protein
LYFLGVVPRSQYDDLKQAFEDMEQKLSNKITHQAREPKRKRTRNQ